MKTRVRPVAWTLAGVVLVALAGWWLGSNLERVEVERESPPSGAAARDEHYAAKALLRRLGAGVVTAENLARLPPPGAALVLSSTSWDLFPGRAEQLRQWVSAGGHLVLPDGVALQDAELLAWVPLLEIPDRQRRGGGAARQHAQAGSDAPAAPARESHDDAQADADAETNDDEAKADGGDPGGQPPGGATDSRAHPGQGTGSAGGEEPPRTGGAPATAPAPRPGTWPWVARRAERCRILELAPQLAPRVGSERQHRLCADSTSTLRPQGGTAPTWLLGDARGPRIASVPVGTGRVSVSTLSGAWTNRLLLQGDNARVLVATLDLREGDTVWFVADEGRTALLRLLWNAAWPALVLAGLALALGLWRAAQRFGPPITAPALARRSMVEQIAGTAGFVARHGGVALHRATLRALERTAQQRVPGYATLLSTRDRADAIARAARVDALAMAEAMEPPRERTPRALASTLALLEGARRNLRARPSPVADRPNPKENDA